MTEPMYLVWLVGTLLKHQQKTVICITIHACDKNYIDGGRKLEALNVGTSPSQHIFLIHAVY